MHTTVRRRWAKEEHDHRLGLVTMLLLSGATGSLALTAFLWPDHEEPRYVADGAAKPEVPASADLEEEASLPAVFGIAGPAAAARTERRVVRDAPATVAAAPARPAPAPQTALPEPPAARASAPSAEINRGEAAALWSRPAEYLLRRSWLGSPGMLTRMLDRPGAVDRYLSLPVVRTVLGSPTLVGWVLGNRAVVGAFLKSPAMRDPAAVRALMASPLTDKILTSPGVQGMFRDPVALAQVLADPEISDWLRANPAAMRVVSRGGAGAAGRGE